VTDLPMTPEGVKTIESDLSVTKNFVDNHVQIGINSLKELINDGHTVKHLRF
jgi:AMP nucleosidase